MRGWSWLLNPLAPVNWRFVRVVILKALVLFIVFNAAYYVVQPMRLLNRVSLYNVIIPGRLRLPFSEYPEQSYNLIVANIDQMLVSHVVSQPKAADEYRVLLIGDSSIWGYLQPPTKTLSECLNGLHLTLPSGRRVRFYNLGYPTLSVMKDWLILRHALRYHPDLVVWSTTLASLYPLDQLGFEVIRAHLDEVNALADQYTLNLPNRPPASTWQDRTLFGQRQEIADWLRHQLDGIGWAATGIDQIIPKFVTPHPVNFTPDDSLLSVNVISLAEAHKIAPRDLSLDVIKAGIDSAGVPVLLVNEPTYRSPTEGVRLNHYYPRWAYDDYRRAMQQTADSNGWHYVDLWDAAPNDSFTDTDFHLTPAAACAYAQRLSAPIVRLAGG